MVSENRTETDRIAFIEQIIEQPARYDFYLALRTLETLYPESPLIGQARRPAQEHLRLGQSPQLSFAPASLTQAQLSKAGKLRIIVRFFGLFGPQGALPLHLTELAHERDLNFGDATLRRFADIFHHRTLSMFYAIWRQAQPVVQRDRPEQDRFIDLLGSLVGLAGLSAYEVDPVPAVSKRYFAGHLGRLAKTPEGLEAILSNFFGVKVQVHSYHPRWLTLARQEQTSLSGLPQLRSLGMGATLGRRVYDAQHSIALMVGPMDLPSYEAMLPGETTLLRMKAWLKSYLGGEWFISSRHLLVADQVPSTQLGKMGRLGWTSWLGKRHSSAPAADLQLSY